MTTATATQQEPTRSSIEIQSEIRETRSRMDATLDELGHRLTARSLVNSALDWWEAPDPARPGSAAVRRAMVSLARQARHHPMPALLIGSGIAWLVAESMEHDGDEEKSTRQPGAGSRRSAVAGTVDEARQAAAQAVDTVKEKASGLSDKMHETTSRLSDQAHDVLERGASRMHDLKEEVKQGYQVSAERFSRACDDYPLAVGAGFAALGALAGLAIPATRREDEIMGDRSDQLVQETKVKATELLESGKTVGVRVLQAVKEESRQQGLTAEAVVDTLSDLTNKGERVVQKAKEEAAQAAEEQGLKPPGAPAEGNHPSLGAGI